MSAVRSPLAAHRRYCYVVASGTFEVILTEGGDPAHVMTRGQLFGELALLYNTPRTATVRAGSAASVWVLTRSVYQGILTGEAMDRTQTTIEQLRVQIPFFSHAPAKQLSQLAYALDHVTIAPGAPLAPTEDALAEGVVYLVDDGSLLGADGSELPKSTVVVFCSDEQKAALIEEQGDWIAQRELLVSAVEQGIASLEQAAQYSAAHDALITSAKTKLT